MNNWFQQQQKDLQQEKEKERKKREIERQKYKKILSQNQSLNSQARLESWLNLNENDQHIFQTLRNGTIPLTSIREDQFRILEPQKWLDKQSIYVRSYEPAKERARIQEQKNLSQVQDRGMYFAYSNDIFLRSRTKSKEQSPLKFGKNQKTQNLRIQDNVFENSILDHSKRDMKMIYFPDWKEVQKENWVSKKNYILSFNQSTPSWKQHEIKSDNQEPYKGGYMVTGDVSRKRIRKLENKRPDFISDTSQDVWRNTLEISQSLRTLKSDKILKNDPNFEIYSTNKKLPFYKKALIDTKSVDHLIPIQHSANKRGLDFKSIRPQKRQKLYNNSVKNAIAIHSLKNVQCQDIVQTQSEEDKTTNQKSQQTSQKQRNSILQLNSNLNKSLLRSKLMGQKQNQYIPKEMKIKETIEEYFQYL